LSSLKFAIWWWIKKLKIIPTVVRELVVSNRKYFWIELEWYNWICVRWIQNTTNLLGGNLLSISVRSVVYFAIWPHYNLKLHFTYQSISNGTWTKITAIATWKFTSNSK
jgi:hypothetical protein